MGKTPTPEPEPAVDGSSEPDTPSGARSATTIAGDHMQSAPQTYLRMQTATASSGELIAMLYDALLRNLSRAEGGLESKDIESAHHALLKSQDIVLELMSSLDMEAEGEAGSIARQMAPLYEYMYRRLLDASVHKETAPIAEVRRLVQPVREAWRFALEQVAQQSASAPRMEDRRG